MCLKYNPITNKTSKTLSIIYSNNKPMPNSPPYYVNSLKHNLNNNIIKKNYNNKLKKYKSWKRNFMLSNDKVYWYVVGMIDIYTMLQCLTYCLCSY